MKSLYAVGVALVMAIFVFGCGDPSATEDEWLDSVEQAQLNTRDAQCLGNGTAARCQELCEELGGTYDAGWGHIGGCRDMPSSADTSGLNFGTTIKPRKVAR